jgi:ArsR family transcriptional regulator, virulence genes transcriptional regulator
VLATGGGSRGANGICRRMSYDMDLAELQANARRASNLLKALSNEHRLVILCELIGGEKSVGEMVRRVGLSQSALSQHLARLRRDDLVRTRREAQTIYYSLSGHHARSVIETLQRLYGGKPGTDGSGKVERIPA